MPQQRGTTTNRLEDIIQALELGRNTGILTVTREQGANTEEGQVTFAQGQATEAQLGSVRGPLALSWLRNWGTCRYVFTHTAAGQSPTAPTAQTPTAGANSGTNQNVRAPFPNSIRGTTNPMQGLNTPTRGATNPMQGLNTPTRGATNPMQGLNTPTRGATNPMQRLNNPMQGPNTPTRGATNPMQGQNTPTRGLNNPMQGQNTPTRGLSNPAQGQNTPTQGLSNPAQGQNTPTRGLNNPMKGQNTPTRGLSNPGQNSLSRGTTKPMQSLNNPKNRPVDLSYSNPIDGDSGGTSNPLQPNEATHNNNPMNDRDPAQTPSNDFWKSSASFLPHAQTVPPYHIQPPEIGLKLLTQAGWSRLHRRLFLLIDGQRSVLELAGLLGHSSDEVKKLLRDLEIIGSIRQEK